MRTPANRNHPDALTLLPACVRRWLDRRACRRREREMLKMIEEWRSGR